MNSITIKRYVIEYDKSIFFTVVSFFSINRWKKIDTLLFRTYFSSVFFHLQIDKLKIIIDVWGKGPFGIILPVGIRLPNIRFMGIIDKIGDQVIIDDFEKYLTIKGIRYEITSIKKQGRTQFYFLFAGLIYIILIIIFLFIFC